MSLVFALKLALILVVTFKLSDAQNDGRYRPFKQLTTTKKPNRNLDGRYVPNRNDGRYYPSNEGRYRGRDDGKYHPTGAGKYNYDADLNLKKDNKIGGGKNSGNKSNDGLSNKNDTNRQNKLITKATNVEPARKASSIDRNGWRILYLYDKEERDGYHYIYETENGINAEEEGHIADLSTGEGLRSTGFYEYTGDDGLLYRVDYIADDGGFVPRGAHIPKTPKHVTKLLEYLKLKMTL